VKILNKDLYITEIDKDGLELDIEIRIEKSVGYLGIEELKEREDDVNVLLVDANFSPITNVKFNISPTRIEDITALDTLDFEVTTTGVISPSDAIKYG
jgi:DNA-directed RNA polymerase subunit alpha